MVPMMIPSLIPIMIIPHNHSVMIQSTVIIFNIESQCMFGVKGNDERYMFCDFTPAPEHASGPDPEALFLCASPFALDLTI